MDGYTHTEANDLPIGTRVQISPAFDLWMQGARYGEVIKHSTINTVQIRLDKMPNKPIWFDPRDLCMLPPV